MDPLSGRVLHDDCISMIVSRSTTFTANFVICCYQVTKFFSTRYGSAIPSSAWGPCNFGPFTDLAISVFREMSINTMFTQILTSLNCGLQRGFMRRTGVRVISSSTKISLNSCSHSGISEYNGSPSSTVVSFLFVFLRGYWLEFHQVALIYHQPKLTLALGEMSLLFTSSCSRTGISPTVGAEDEDKEDDEE